MDRTELYVADEVFVCGTGAELQAVVNVDHYKVGDGNIGPIFTRLEQHYHDIVRSKFEGYEKWQTSVY